MTSYRPRAYFEFSAAPTSARHNCGQTTTEESLMTESPVLRHIWTGNGSPQK
jgi:hypothetical protein